MTRHDGWLILDDSFDCSRHLRNDYDDSLGTPPRCPVVDGGDVFDLWRTAAISHPTCNFKGCFIFIPMLFKVGSTNNSTNTQQNVV